MQRRFGLLVAVGVVALLALGFGGVAVLAQHHTAPTSRPAQAASAVGAQPGGAVPYRPLLEEPVRGPRSAWLVTEVPRVIPQAGVNINNQVTLFPLANTRVKLTAAQAIAIGRTYDNAQPFPATAVLASVTVPDSIVVGKLPPNVHASPIENVPA
jgi:hypothetical protein